MLPFIILHLDRLPIPLTAGFSLGTDTTQWESCVQVVGRIDLFVHLFFFIFFCFIHWFIHFIIHGFLFVIYLLFYLVFLFNGVLCCSYNCFTSVRVWGGGGGGEGGWRFFYLFCFPIILSLCDLDLFQHIISLSCARSLARLLSCTLSFFE